jgi:hypothetical protein
MKPALCSALVIAAMSTFAPALAEDVSNPVTDFQVSLYRDGGSSDFQGWIKLLNGSSEAGFIYIRNGQPGRPFLGSTKYVVIDIPVAMLDVTVTMLSSSRPVFITYTDNGNPANASAFLHVGGNALPGDEQILQMQEKFSVDASALKAAQ